MEKTPTKQIWNVLGLYLSRLRKVRYLIFLHTALYNRDICIRVPLCHVPYTPFWRPATDHWQNQYVARYGTGTTVVTLVSETFCGCSLSYRHILWNDNPKTDKKDAVPEKFSVTTVSHYSITGSVCRWFVLRTYGSRAMFKDCKHCLFGVGKTYTKISVENSPLLIFCVSFCELRGFKLWNGGRKVKLDNTGNKEKYKISWYIA